MSDIFHDGELELQNIDGLDPEYVQRFERAIRPYMPDQHRRFFESLPMIIVGALDENGCPWASAMFGEESFITSPEQDILSIASKPLLHDALSLQIEADAKLGLLGLLPESRRRNRMNGYVKSNDNGVMQICVDQSFGNCPKYIQKRKLIANKNMMIGKADIRASLSEEAQDIINRSDTFFMASRTAEMDVNPKNGVDVSHRGGNIGFVKILSDKKFIFPDFSGNQFFNTLGNIQTDERVGIWFPDFETGDSLFITGRAEIIWDEDRIKEYRGALRLITIEVDKSVFGKSILPLIGTVYDVSPFLDATGVWQN